MFDPIPRQRRNDGAGAGEGAGYRGHRRGGGCGSRGRRAREGIPIPIGEVFSEQVTDAEDEANEEQVLHSSAVRGEDSGPR